MWVATDRSGEGDILPIHEAFRGTSHTLEVPPVSAHLPSTSPPPLLHVLLRPSTPFDTMQVPPVAEEDYADRLECDDCGPETYVGVRCVNGANLFKVCERYGSFRVDRSPPKCEDGWVVLGQGLRPGFQASPKGTNMTNLVFAMEDRESGIAFVNYTLHDVSNASAYVRDPPVPLGWIDHPKLPEPRIQLVDLAMKNGHKYSVELRITNNLGLAASCSTTEVAIDTTPPVAGVALILAHDDDNDVEMPEPSAFQYSRQIIKVALRNFGDPPPHS